MESLEEIAAGVRAGRVDPVALVEQALQRAEETAALNAVVHLDVEGARKAAAGHDRAGALAGVPVLVKEIVEVAGLPYRCGSAAMDEIGRQDAAVLRPEIAARRANGVDSVAGLDPLRERPRSEELSIIRVRVDGCDPQ